MCMCIGNIKIKKFCRVNVTLERLNERGLFYIGNITGISKFF